jgi:DNA-binding NarL/FixJ family response regulator
MTPWPRKPARPKRGDRVTPAPNARVRLIATDVPPHAPWLRNATHGILRHLPGGSRVSTTSAIRMAAPPPHVMASPLTDPSPASALDRETPAPAASLVLIEDNRLLRDGLAAMITRESHWTLLAATDDIEHALYVTATHHPTVVLLDFGLAEADSLVTCARLREVAPDARVIVMGIGAPQEDVAAFIRAGAAGFIMKDATIDEFLSTLRVIAEGKQTLPRALTQSLFAQIVRDEHVSNRSIFADSVRLTTREREIIDLLGQGLSNKEIAARLYISVHTVKSHVHNILEKLSLHTRLEVAAYSRSTEHPHG